LKVSGIADDLQTCIQMAEESIQSGKALKKLNELKSFEEEA
jgi:anthranilate phosphoribosyltransferase